MAIVYRLEKGSPLTVAEIDNNFRELEMGLRRLEEKAIEPLRGLRFRVEGVQMIIEIEGGDILQRIDLPVISFKHKGEWVAGDVYVANDIVTKAGGVFICSRSHSATHWEADTAYWAVLMAPFEWGLESRRDLGRASAAAEAGTGSREGRWPTLPIFSRSEMPAPTLGQQGYVAQPDGTLHLVYANGTQWRLQHNHEIIA